jgi:hypothetical protein
MVVALVGICNTDHRYGYGCRYTFLYLPASKQASEHPKNGQQLRTFGQNSERRPF